MHTWTLTPPPDAPDARRAPSAPHAPSYRQLFRQHYQPRPDRTPSWLRQLWLWF